MLQFAYPFSIS